MLNYVFTNTLMVTVSGSAGELFQIMRTQEANYGKCIIKECLQDL